MFNVGRDNDLLCRYQLFFKVAVSNSNLVTASLACHVGLMRRVRTGEVTPNPQCKNQDILGVQAYSHLQQVKLPQTKGSPHFPGPGILGRVDSYCTHWR